MTKSDGDGANDQWGFTMNGWPPPQMFVWQAGGDVANKHEQLTVDSQRRLRFSSTPT
jgi:hypothetical protein